MISTHILDTSCGQPAAQVQVTLFHANTHRGDETSWVELSRGSTNTDGRFIFDVEYKTGFYKIIFFIDAYYQQKKQEHFFIVAPVIFQVTDPKRKYHVPLLLNPYGYSTYRGS